MPSIETPLLIVGHGPAALVAAKVASGAGLPCLLAGHQSLDQHDPVQLDEQSLAVLEPDGVLGVLRPYAASQEPFAIAPGLFEQGLKHHCVADMLVTVYDGMWLTDSVEVGQGRSGVLTDGRARWRIEADRFLDASDLPTELNAAVQAGSNATNQLLDSLPSN